MNRDINRQPGGWTCRNCRCLNLFREKQCQQCGIIRNDQPKQKSPAAISQGNASRKPRSRTPGPRNRVPRANNSQFSKTNPRFKRGSQSVSNLNLQRESNVTEDAGASGNNFSHKKKRQHPIGYNALRKMLDSSPEEIVLELQTECSGFDLMLEKPDDINLDKMCLMLQVLARASETAYNKECLNILLTKVFQASFINHLMKYTVTIIMGETDINLLCVYFENLWVVLNTFAHAMPTLAMSHIFPLIGSCMMGINQKSNPQLAEILPKYESTKGYLDDVKEEWHVHDERRVKMYRNRWEDDSQPPENFRELTIVPTIQELNDLDRPFLRRNIIHGKYEDVEHYLDVQFRLLREDFVRPLRLGIQEIKTNVKSRNRDIYIYKNVEIVGTDVKFCNIMHIVKLTLPRKFKVENSKRLMYGNLVCFSCDNFETVLFGSISERKPEMLKDSLIGIKFDSDVKISSRKVYTMVESRSYFVAYKHVLKALQFIREDNFPMREFIVSVDNNMIPPDYVTDETQYDLRVLRSKDMMKEAEVHNPLFRRSQRIVAQAAPIRCPPLQNVRILRNLGMWPSSDDLRIDDSQRRALVGALTSKLSIIQGPPGTGKTFIGLKIAQVLLHNSEHWKAGTRKSPILVVCFTNHALDQFLEGMTPFTQNIVRIGGRTKSEIIGQFQINSLIKSLRSRRAMPIALHANNNAIMMTLTRLENDIKSWRNTLQQLREPTGIIMFDDLVKHDAVPETVKQQFPEQNLDLVKFLLDPHLVNSISSSALAEASTNTSEKFMEKGFDDDDDVWHDAEDLYAEEEETRRLDDDFSEERSATHVTSNCSLGLRYCASLEQFHAIIASLEEEKLNASVSDAMKLDKIIVEVRTRIGLLNYGFSVPFDKERANYLQRFRVTSLHVDDRWLLYRHWIQNLLQKVTGRLRMIEEKYEHNVAAYNEIKDQQYLYVMRHASVVGMTTTGAAQYSSVIQALEPSIVIIEEAAEILEAHVITALTSQCQHLIMIGDHQQLQPSSTVYELATNFNLCTSLFERLINNKVSFQTLEYQHRMRPNISKLLVPSIYPNLKDHESVHTYPHIRGIQKDVFFIDHREYEDGGSDDNNSKANNHEAKLIMALCRHLMLQGYSKEKMTVLTPYSGQFFLLKKYQRKYMECDGVRVTIVDNFQGEESDIILLSLVRSNELGNVGFLKTENRICVALSRAKHGLYIAGNMDQLQRRSDLWKKINNDLLDDGAIGKSLILKCENHPDVISSVATEEDILLKSPEGGCRRPCMKPLPKCGHECPKTCHILDPEHEHVKCKLPCPHIICDRKHPCPLKCWQKCKPCTVPVPKTFECGHTHDVACSTYEEDHLCQTRVKRILPDCQHEASMPCHKDPSQFPCPLPCDIRPSCGHKCTKKCHVNDDPEHNEYLCYHPCARSPDGCSQEHKCNKKCYEDCGPCLHKAKKKADCGHTVDVLCSTKVEDIVCDKKCKRVMPCGHYCKRMCKDPCGGCKVVVEKTVQECQHVIKVECDKPALKSDCSGKCQLLLPCGHQCQAQCKDPCTTECKALVSTHEKCPKGHEIRLPCYLLNKVSGEDSWLFCRELCGTALDCKHICKGRCGKCLHGRLHVACKEKCERPLVCGHICKADCSSACPPCQAECPMKCAHSRCLRKCGDPCNPCQEKCPRSCEHQMCKSACGKKCSQKLCEKPCPKKLDCGHPCVGFCGDPCPPLCRICNREELTEILFGSEDEDDARFVLLEECGHVIEASGLEGWMSQHLREIGMKSCPRCKKPIYNNRRYSEFILKSYKEVSDVKLQYYRRDPKKQAEDIENLMSDMEDLSGKEVEKIKRSLPRISSKTAVQKYHAVSDNEMVLYNFQVQVLKAVALQLKDNTEFANALNPHLNFVKKRVMEQNLRIASQMMEEITCELQRITVLPFYWKLLKRVSSVSSPPLQKIINSIKVLMDPTIKFDKEQESKVKHQLKESEKYIGGLGITDKERLEILNAMDLRQGHWFKCPNGHIYCIGECGGAMEEGKCPECKATVGGGSHRLRDDNTLATEMDGAVHAAYSEHYDMRNFVLND